MKKIAKLLLVVIILTICFNLVGCTDLVEAKWFNWNNKFKLTIEGVSGWNTLDFEISKSYYIIVESLDGSFVDSADIQIEHNKENIAITNSYHSRDKAKFTLYCYDLGSNDELKISYKGKTVTVNYNIVDFDFEANGYEAVTSIDALDKYPEFMDMILSIQYHEFEEPFIGFDSTWVSNTSENEKYGKMSVYRRNCSESKADPNYISTDYLQYIMDSVYYPEKFDTVSENPVSTTDVNIFLPYNTDVSAGADSVNMNIFSISYSVCDPCCTAKYPLTSMTFNVQAIESKDPYPSRMYILLERYPEKFFQYKIGDLTLNILFQNEEDVSAYFFDEKYFYTLACHYDQEYK